MGYGVADTGVDFEFVSPAEAHALLKSDKAVFLDARDEDDFKISRLQTSYSLSANDIMFKPDKIDKTLLQRCKTLTAAGKLVVCVSDSGISGMANRGHVSRCRHIAQWLHELGLERDCIRRLQGGLNMWKSQGLDGIIGDTRMYYAGSLMTVEKAKEVARLAALADAEPAGDGALEAGLATLALGDASGAGAPGGGGTAGGPAAGAALVAAEDGAGERAQTPAPTPALAPPQMVTEPTVYRVLKGEIFKKAAPDAEKIIKLEWAVDRLVRTTGEVFVGSSGGKWAQLDPEAGEKKGWVYVQGPGFGPSTSKIVSQYLVF